MMHTVRSYALCMMTWTARGGQAATQSNDSLTLTHQNEKAMNDDAMETCAVNATDEGITAQSGLGTVKRDFS